MNKILNWIIAHPDVSLHTWSGPFHSPYADDYSGNFITFRLVKRETGAKRCQRAVNAVICEDTDEIIGLLDGLYEELGEIND